MEVRKTPGQSAASSLGLFNLSANKSSGATLKPPIVLGGIDYELGAIAATDNSEIIVGLTSGEIYIYDEVTGELKRKFDQTDFVGEEWKSSDGSDEGDRKVRDYYHEHQLRLIAPYKQSSLLTASNQEVRFLDRNTGQRLRTYASFPDKRICSLLETDDGNIFSASCPANQLRLTDQRTGEVIWERNAAPALFENPLLNNISAALSGYGSMQSWFAELASYISAIENTDSVYCAVKCPNGDIACGTTGGAIFILDPKNGNYKNVFRAYEGEKWVPHGASTILSGLWMKSIKAVAALPNNDIVSGGHNGPLFIWDHKTGQQKHRLVAGERDWFRVSDVRVCNGMVISISETSPNFGGCMDIWDSNSGEHLKTVDGIQAKEFAVTKDGCIVFAEPVNKYQPEYSIVRLPIDCVLQHKSKSMYLYDLPFPEKEVQSEVGLGM